MQTLILGSSSKYRAALLKQWRVPFSQAAPNIDETPSPNEAPLDLAVRLAKAKAAAVAKANPNCFVIGSDQVANVDGQPVGKPHTLANARAQLWAVRGKTLQYHTAVCCAYFDAASDTLRSAQGLDTVTVRYKNYSAAQLERYLSLEQPLDCAGASKSEGLGILLMDEISSNDPSSLIGLPLMWTANLLSELGYEVLDYAV